MLDVLLGLGEIDHEELSEIIDVLVPQLNQVQKR